MNYSTLPVDLELPEHPILLDIHALAVRFQTLTDRRAARGVRYPLVAILTIAVLAKLTGANQVRDVAEWARHRQRELCALFSLERPTMPHPTTWSRILGDAVEPEALTRATQAVLTTVASEVPERGSGQVVLDGKPLRGPIPTGQTQGVHLLAAYRPQEGVVLLQVEVGAKENEISAAPRILQQLDLRGMLVSGDAMFTQRDRCVSMVQHGGDYLLPVKENQPTLYTDIDTLFDPVAIACAGGEAATDVRTATTVEKSHGRLTERTITVSSLLNDDSPWPYLAQVFRLEQQVTQRGTTTTEVMDGITSQPPEVASPERVVQQVQTHWQIEPGLHGRRDGSLQEDRALVRRGQAPHVQAALNNVVVGLFLKHQYANMAAGRRELDAIINRALFQQSA
jgi:predicted transposase YbfD/YdcC